MLLQIIPLTVLSSILFLLNCTDVDVDSLWRDSEIVIDGNGTEW